MENAREQGAYLRRRLEALAPRFDFVGEVRGAGLLQGMDFVRDRLTREPFPAEVRPGKLVERAARNRGLLLRTGADFAAFAPPLIVTRADIDEMCDLFADALVEVDAALATSLGGQ